MARLSEPPPARVLAGVALVAGSVLAMQVLLTRLFSAALFYHFAFFSISLALLGTGAGALLLYTRPGWFARHGTEAQLSRWALLLTGLLLLVPLVLVRLDYYGFTDVTPGFTATLGAAAVLAALPFLAAGVVVALAIQRYIASVGRVYAFDLGGAAIGALAIVPLLRLASAPALLVGLGLATGLAALLFGWSSPGARRRGALAFVAAVALTTVAAATDLYRLPAPYEPRLDVVADHWSPTARVVGYEPNPDSDILLTYDQDFAPVPHHRRGGPMPTWRKLGLGPQSIGYELTGPGHALIIGGGGGRDIFNALTNRQTADVIELNRGNRDVVDGELGHWSGRPYSLPGVSTTIGDGRSELAARDTRYDQIHIGFTNNLGANLGAAYALAENHLYTVEAFDEYFEHLKPGGLISISRPYRFRGEEALRATVLALESLRRQGVDRPERGVVSLMSWERASGPFGTVLARREPFTTAELALIRRLARARTVEGPAHVPPFGGFRGLAYAPGGPYALEWAALARADSPREFCEGHPTDICAPSDDQPFFANGTRLSGVFHSGEHFSRTPFLVLLSVLAIVAVLSALALALPLALIRRAGSPPATSLVFFAAIRVGFLVFEVVLVQRFVLFLGFPTYALSVVLFSLLLFTGAGSWASTRFREPRRALLLALGAACAITLAAAFGLQPLLEELIHLPFAARVAISIALLAPAGLTLGMAMPIGLRRLFDLHPEGIPWAWAINGITSVLASVLTLVVAIEWGFTVATLIALGSYALAFAHAAVGRWPAPYFSTTTRR